ncbi:MAG TPA: hypothetical protein VFV58_23105 [Blastocatellia bacterium]|jgi:hypothetical protein|nr:hypothetical protein [Blastocatellia bacterium]
MLPDRDKPNKLLSDRIKRLLARLLPDRREARPAAGSEDERKRQALLALRQRLRSGLHQRLGK